MARSAVYLAAVAKLGFGTGWLLLVIKLSLESEKRIQFQIQFAINSLINENERKERGSKNGS